MGPRDRTEADPYLADLDTEPPTTEGEGDEPSPQALTRSAEIPPMPILGPGLRVALWATGLTMLLTLGIAGIWLSLQTQEVAVAPQDQTAPHSPQLASDDAIGVAIPASKTLRVDPDDEDRWQGVATSAGPYAMVAVWSDSEVFVSHDDGRSFAQTLAGPGEVRGVAFDLEGNLYAVRGHGLLGVHRPDGATQWRRIPWSGETLALATGGGWLGWLSLQHHEERGTHALLALSNDSGMTWQHQAVPGVGNSQNALRIEPDGTLRLLSVSADCHEVEIERYRGHIDGRPFAGLPWPVDQGASGLALGRDGWTYAVGAACADDTETHLCTIGPGPQPDVGTSELGVDWDLRAASNIRTTLAVSGRQLIQMDGARVALLDTNAPKGIGHFATDGIGRALATAGDSLVRWSARHGWRVIFSPDADYELENRVAAVE